MAGQAESERERRAKIINAEGEFHAAEKLVQAAAMISAQPIALQLRFLQTMKEISREHSTTTILPCQLICLRRSPKGPKAEPQTNRSRHIESDAGNRAAKSRIKETPPC